MMFNINRIFRNFCEKASQLSKKLEDSSPLVDELSEADSTDANFSLRVGSRMKTLLKLFSEAEEALNDAKVEKDDLVEAAKDNGEEGITKTAELISKSFSDLEKEFNAVKEDIKKTLDIPAKDEKTNVPVSITEPKKNQESDEKPQAPEEAKTIQEETVKASEKLSNAKVNVPENIQSLNFSTILKGKCNILSENFSSLMDKMAYVTEFACNFSEKINGIDSEIENEDGDSDAELTEEYFSDDEELYNEYSSDKTEETDMNDKTLNADVNPNIVKLAQFCEKMADDISEASNSLDENSKEIVAATFTELAECLEKNCVEKELDAEGMDEVSQKVEECKATFSDIANFCNYSGRKMFFSINKQFSDLDAIMDNFSVPDAPEGVSAECIHVDDKVQELNDEINDKIDDFEHMTNSLPSEVKNFARITLCTIRGMKCFSEEDVDNKLNALESYADTYHKDHPEDCQCDECCDKHFYFSEDADEEMSVEEKDEKLNESIDNLKEVSQDIKDEEVKNFALEACDILGSIVCFSEEEVEEKLNKLEEVTDKVEESVADDKAEEYFFSEDAEEDIEDLDEESIEKYFSDEEATDDENLSVEEKDDKLNESISELKEVSQDIKDEAVKNFAIEACEILGSMVCFSEEEVETKLDKLEEVADKVEESVADNNKTVEEKDKELNNRVDEIEEKTEKVADEKVKSFSRMMCKTLRSMVCFSEEDVANKEEMVDEVEKTIDTKEDATEGDKEEVIEQDQNFGYNLFSDQIEVGKEESEETDEVEDVKEEESEGNKSSELVQANFSVESSDSYGDVIFRNF